MGFALCPDDGYPRLWRFVAPGVLPPGMLCSIDREFNILTIDKEAYDQLQPLAQHSLLRTKTNMYYEYQPHYVAAE